MKIAINFTKINETPGAYRYQEVDAEGTPLTNDAEGAQIGALYLRKAKLQGEAPEKLTVTVEA